MEKFIDSQEFRDLNIGFAFDEGLPHPDDIIQIVHGERTIWREYEQAIMSLNIW
jgi:aminoacylase